MTYCCKLHVKLAGLKSREQAVAGLFDLCIMCSAPASQAGAAVRGNTWPKGEACGRASPVFVVR